ncbi:MAG: hypothetical protein WCT28_03540 [Patescibacteria group bacterium]
MPKARITVEVVNGLILAIGDVVDRYEDDTNEFRRRDGFRGIFPRIRMELADSPKVLQAVENALSGWVLSPPTAINVLETLKKEVGSAAGTVLVAEQGGGQRILEETPFARSIRTIIVAIEDIMAEFGDADADEMHERMNSDVAPKLRALRTGLSSPDSEVAETLALVIRNLRESERPRISIALLQGLIERT